MSHVMVYCTHPKVSVIVVNYNQGPYISRAIDSILSQTFDDFKIMIVDDGSQDGSIEMIRTIVDRCPNTIDFLYHQDHQNRGICNTYGLGISSAKSKYVAFMEADDLWEKNYLERKVEVLDRFPEVGVVFSKYKIMSENWYGYDMVFRQWVLGMSIIKDRPFHNLRNLMKKNNVATFSAFVTRKSLLDSITIDCHPDIVFFDWWILVQLSMRSKFYLDNGSFVFWRQHRDSTLGKQSLDLHKKRLNAYMNAIYEKIGQEIGMLKGGDKLYYLRKSCILPYFLSFYQNPSIKTLKMFVRLDPLWALESMVSYVINYWKYA